MRKIAYVLATAFVVFIPAAALAQAAPAASPAASPAPTPTPGFSLHAQGADVFVSQEAAGPGLSPPEAPAFVAGLPLSPMSPYDWFTSAAQTPGNAGELQYLIDINDRTRAVTFDAQVVAGAYGGDLNNLMYSAEPWLGPLDPHEGRSPVNYAINFPTSGGSGVEGSAAQAVLPYAASLASNDGAWKISGGYINLTQTDTFVFDPPAVTNANPSVGVQLAETLGPGMPNVDAWNPSPSTLPLLGADAVLAHGPATVELTDALLPVLQGTQAHLAMGSYVLDRGDGGRFSAQIANVTTSGAPIFTTTFFGADQTLYPGSQGRLFSSLLANQVQTIAGVRAFVHPWRGDDVLVELGEGWYHDGLAALPGTQSPGSYEHFAFTRHFNTILDAGAEYYRFDPRYADVILPYGVPENVWSVAWSWPGQWLKSTYQMVNNAVIGINREGYRAHADYARGRFEAHTGLSVWRQIEPATISNMSIEGWVDGYFLPQADQYATLAWQRQVNCYTAWHWAHDDVTLDSVWDRSYRPALDPIDFVSMNYPQIVGSFQHHWNKKMVAAIGYGRYSANGYWSTTPVQGIYGVAFAGGQWDFSHGQQLLVQLRRYGLTGLPSEPGGPPPTLRGTVLIVDQRIQL
ncbi:MAG TPA: hypothetical protein VMA98_01450 [Candidatus Acidoferrales bacterium]|nr:hypothetical protein [Candidatus Acidoferrales bacterium]